MSTIGPIGKPVIPPVPGPVGVIGLPWAPGGGMSPRGLSLLSGGTFTRSTEGSYLTGAPTDGTAAFLAWAGVNVRRIENRGDGLGPMLLMEGSRTNDVLNSRDMTAGTWSAGVSVTTTPAYASGPDGAALGCRSLVLSTGYSRYASLSAVTRAWSVWARNTTTGFHRTAIGTAVVPGAVAFDEAAITTTYKRKGALWTVAGGPACLPCDGRDYTGVGGTGPSAIDAITDLHQAEAGYFPSSAIRTAGSAVTRGADALSYAVGQYPASFLTRGYRITFAPDCTSAEMIAAAINMGLLQTDPTSTNDSLYLAYTGAQAQVWIRRGSAAVEKQNVSWAARGQALTIEVSPGGNYIKLSGFTTGNGTFALGGAWAMNAGAMSVGGFLAIVAPFFGRIGPTMVAL